MNTYAVIDFETTGLSPAQGARPTEIAVVLVDQQGIKDRFQSLMNPGVSIPADIQALTGISNAMVKKAPGVAQVMQQACKFAANHPIVAHNAAFDQKFWEVELQRLNLYQQQKFACSMLLSRRIFPELPNHRLGTLVQSLKLPNTGRSHRALADAEATAHLFLHLQQALRSRFQLASVSHALLLAIQAKSRSQLEACVLKYGGLRAEQMA